MAESQVERLHAACDECRTRKLKCHGEWPRCSRCEREGIQCVYSPQKRMGRPRKRRREEAATPADLQSENYRDSGVESLGATSHTDHELIADSDLTTSEFQGSDDFANFLLTPQHHNPSLTDDYTKGHTYNTDFGLNPTIDPSLWGAPTTASQVDPSTATAPCQPESCTCFSVMYLAMAELQTLSLSAFPAIIYPQRRAMATASSIMQCEKCPKGTFSTIQNTQSLSTLLVAVAERFHNALRQIDEQTEQLERTGEKKPFRVADNNPLQLHLHTGTPDCPMGFDIQLDAKDWKALAKKTLKAEVLGGGSNPTPLVALLDQFEQRQHFLHASHVNLEERTRIFGEQNSCSPGDATCVRMINQVRKMVLNMQWE